MDEVKHSPLHLSFKCPKCDVPSFFPEGINEFDGTTNCKGCGALLLIEDRKVYPFHEFLHAKDPRWPKDGKDTGYVEMIQNGSLRDYKTTPWIIGMAQRAFEMGYLYGARIVGMEEDAPYKKTERANAKDAFLVWWNNAAGVNDEQQHKGVEELKSDRE